MTETKEKIILFGGLICLMVVMVLCITACSTPSNAVDYDAYIDPYMYPPGAQRDSARFRRQQGLYNNEVTRRQREDNFYWQQRYDEDRRADSHRRYLEKKEKKKKNRSTFEWEY